MSRISSLVVVLVVVLVSVSSVSQVFASGWSGSDRPSYSVHSDSPASKDGARAAMQQVIDGVTIELPIDSKVSTILGDKLRWEYLGNQTIANMKEWPTSLLDTFGVEKVYNGDLPDWEYRFGTNGVSYYYVARSKINKNIVMYGPAQYKHDIETILTNVRVDKPEVASNKATKSDKK